MYGPSELLRALRPRTYQRVKPAEKSELEQSQNTTVEDEVDGDTSKTDEIDLHTSEELKDSEIDENENGDDYNENDNDVDNDDEDDYDDDEPRLMIKEEPEEEIDEQEVAAERRYECKACVPAMEFPNLVEYLQHLKDDHPQKPQCHECPHCGFMTQHPKRLQRHIAAAHKDLRGAAAIFTAGPCSSCTFVANSSAEMESHQRLQHQRRRSFRCAKCNYTTHVRARYTKHVKYHSMPMTKCDDCDFRTPYKWNLDRHARNHGGGGQFQCRGCNFTADIRQSLTVHETNHHDPPLGQSVKKINSPNDRKQRSGIKRYNQVGASDFRDQDVSQLADDVATENSMDDSSSAITGAECIALKCDEKGCQFITAWDSEMQRHLIEFHGPCSSPSKSRKPVPMLIPLSPENKTNNTTESNGSPSSSVKVPRVRVRPELAKIARDSEIAKLLNNQETTNVKKELAIGTTFEKRNASFFDKLKERLLTTVPTTSSSKVTVSNINDLKCWCTFEANSPEQLAIHKTTHHTALSVSHGLLRCPKCGEFRKSSTDLQMHMKLCQATCNNLIINSNNQDGTVNVAGTQYGDFEFPFQPDWDGSVGGPNSSESSADGAALGASRRVFKCPHCPFWASTASRFHVHIVGHLNRKPFECSLCAYRSNWRWDITKHIKLKAARDPAHLSARVLMTDETGRRNYSKYNKYLVQMDQLTPDEQNNEGQSSGDVRLNREPRRTIIMSSKNYSLPLELASQKRPSYFGMKNGSAKPLPSLHARSQGQSLLKNPSTNSPTVAISVHPVATSSASTAEETKRTLWKCKRCNYRDANKEMVVLHVKSHYETLDTSSESIKTSFACNECPFIADDASTLAMHQVHHRPNLEAIFKCYRCPYYVSTKGELLEHARLHGEELASVHGSDGSPNKPHNQPTISPRSIEVTGEHVSHPQTPLLQAAAATKAGSSASAPPLLLDTRALPDTPLVWVSRHDGTFAKMLKCRHCPHVSSRRAEVLDHETMHAETLDPNMIACPDCGYSCVRKDVMEAHKNMHQGALGTIHCLVDQGRTDAQQLEDLTALLGLSKTPILGPEPDLQDPRLVHSCSKCPARFLCEKDLLIHFKYHSTDQAYLCEWCSYRARQPAHLAAHQKAHTSAYKEQTKAYLTLYGHSQRYPPPRTACVETESKHDGEDTDIAWIVVEPTNSEIFGQPRPRNDQRSESQVFTCAKCPARYFKLDALQYHMTLHGSNNRFQCTECDYSSKTAQNLMKHQVVHRRHTEASEPPVTNSPVTTDPTFNYYLHGNPNFVYQGYVKNGKFREKRYKCHKCPSAFEKREQYRVHLTLHGAKQRYRCDTCDYSVKYYANYVQHLKKHQANAQAQASRRQLEVATNDNNGTVDIEEVKKSRRKSTISTVTSATMNNLSSINSSSTGTFSISNQDKQSMLLMQKKSISTAEIEANNAKLFRCHECPFSSSDKDALDCHRRRHGIERLTPSCPHCNYVPRKDETPGEHIKLHFTRLYKPESYLVLELLSLTMKRVSLNKKDDKHKENELLFRDCGDGKFLPVVNANSIPINITNSSQEKVVIDPNTGEATHRFSI